MSNIARLLVMLALVANSAVLAQGYPDRPIKVVVPWPPGQTTDVVARLLSEKLVPVLGQPLVIENRPGAGGVIGSDAVSKANTQCSRTASWTGGTVLADRPVRSS